MADTAAEPNVRLLLHLPEHSTTVGAAERRPLAGWLVLQCSRLEPAHPDLLRHARSLIGQFRTGCRSPALVTEPPRELSSDLVGRQDVVWLHHAQDARRHPRDDRIVRRLDRRDSAEPMERQ